MDPPFFSVRFIESYGAALTDSDARLALIREHLHQMSPDDFATASTLFRLLRIIHNNSDSNKMTGTRNSFALFSLSHPQKNS